MEDKDTQFSHLLVSITQNLTNTLKIVKGADQSLPRFNAHTFQMLIRANQQIIEQSILRPTRVLRD